MDFRNYKITPIEILFEENQREFEWTAITDKIAGGLSKADLIQHEEYLEMSGHIKKSGILRWAALRSKRKIQDLSNYNFIEIRLRTDGQPFEFQMEYKEGWQDEKLSVTIDLVKDHWTTWHVDMDDLKLFNMQEGYMTRRPKDEFKETILRYNFLHLRDESSDFKLDIEYIKFH
ncbi:CIA30 family protein [Nonlabens ponticola]|uniref:CIA30 family protein n=1 Tax=Nonlabens ponticola TaxID=2496866 RepID=UPI0013E0D239|nr:CIA30 family protein [Nonlabens ponticola]